MPVLKQKRLRWQAPVRAAVIHLVLNLRARRLAHGAPVLSALREAARGTCILHETRTLEELAAATNAIFAARPPAVVLAGGDGTYMACLTALRRVYGNEPLPAIGLAPGGTVSTVARNYGMRGSLAEYAARIVEACRAPKLTTRDAPTITVVDDDGCDRTGFIFGTGLVARFFDLYEADGARGYAGAARIVGRIFASSFVGGPTARRILTPAPARLALEGVQEPASAYSLIVASAVRDLGLHMRVTYRAGEDPSRVHVVASPLGPRALGPQMPLVLLGKRLRGQDHVDALAREATIDFPTRSPYVLDGDVFHAQRLTVRAGPTLRCVIPARS